MGIHGGILKGYGTLFLVLTIVVLAACGGGTQTDPAAIKSSPQNPGSLAGNWQFTMSGPPDNSFTGVLQGGFLLQDAVGINGSSKVHGNINYLITNAGTTTPCGRGAALVNGTINSNLVTLTATAGTETFTLNGTLGTDGSSMAGTYSFEAGTDATTGGPCGTAQMGLAWSAKLVPAIAGDVQGFLHSSVGTFNGQNITLTGNLNQDANIGSASAAVTGWLTFQGYSCLGSSHQSVTVTGSISGDSLLLYLFSDSGVNIGYIGQLPGTTDTSTAANFASIASGGYAVQGTGAYGVTTKSCPSGTSSAGDRGNVCLGFGTSACTQPVSLYSTVEPPPGSIPTDYVAPTLTSVSFPPVLLGANPSSQTVAITNTDPSGLSVTGLTLVWTPFVGTQLFSGFSDFNGLPNFTEQDTCAAGGTWTGGSWNSNSFNLAPRQSCLVTFTFSPQQSCTWIPVVAGSLHPGTPPSQCPPFLGSSVSSPPVLQGSLRVMSPKSADSLKSFLLLVSGVGMSAIVPSTPELDFGSEAVSESSAPQSLSFTNRGLGPVQILAPTSTPCVGTHTVPQDAQLGLLSGLQVVQGLASLDVNPKEPHSVVVDCDSDSSTGLPNFQISSDSCSGKLLMPQEACSLKISYVPQSNAVTGFGQDYFLGLNTQLCSGAGQSNCEIDSGRFPVELKTVDPSPLRMTPGAGVDFGYQVRGTYSTPMTVTLTNDSNDPHAGTVQFNGIVVSGDYQEMDDCGSSLDPGKSCTVTVVFNPSTSGFDPGSIKISISTPGYPSTSLQTITLRGFGQ